MFFALHVCDSFSAFSSLSAPTSPSLPTRCLSGFRPSSVVSFLTSRRSGLFPEVAFVSIEVLSWRQLKSDKRPPTRRGLGDPSDAVTEKEGYRGISGIHVPIEGQIRTSKSQLLDAIVATMFDSEEETTQFRHVSSCLDSILHAEHRSILEDLRIDYGLTYFMENKETTDTSFVPDMMEPGTPLGSIKVGSMNKCEEDKIGRNLLPSNFTSDSESPSRSPRHVKGISVDRSRIVVPPRFQRALMQLLHNAEFEELSTRDLMLTSTLNTNYLLTLPIHVDWKKASESNAIIFRRGYTSERQNGLLIAEKLDYLQSNLLQGIIFFLVKPLKKVGLWLTENVHAKTTEENETQIWAKRIRLWLNELPLFQLSNSYAPTSDNLFNSLVGIDHRSDCDFPLLVAAQRAIHRYEGILSAVGPRGRLLKKLLAWIGLIPSTTKQQLGLESDNASETSFREIFLSRISLSDIWEPASRKSCDNDLWKMFKTAVSILFARSILQEPAFEELVLIYTKETPASDIKDEAEYPVLQLKIYERIPIPDLPVIFPHKNLSFRILDSTWDRYQLLVNRILNEKTIASGFGSVHFLLDASEQQQFKEAILAYAVLLKAKNGQVNCSRSIGDECERFVREILGEKIEMPIHKAIKTLARLGLVTENSEDGNVLLRVTPCPGAYKILKQRWNSLF